MGPCGPVAPVSPGAPTGPCRPVGPWRPTAPLQTYWVCAMSITRIERAVAVGVEPDLDLHPAGRAVQGGRLGGRLDERREPIGARKPRRPRGTSRPLRPGRARRPGAPRRSVAEVLGQRGVDLARIERPVVVGVEADLILTPPSGQLIDQPRLRPASSARRPPRLLAAPSLLRVRSIPQALLVPAAPGPPGDPVPTYTRKEPAPPTAAPAPHALSIPYALPLGCGPAPSRIPGGRARPVLPQVSTSS